MDGLEVARRLPRGVPLVLVSGMSEAEIRERARSLEDAINAAVDILPKPVDYDALSQLLRTRVSS